MNVPILTFFNNKGGVGKTSLIYHLAWMFAQLGKRVVAADLDPQANLTAAFLTDDQVYDIWNCGEANATVFQCVKPLASVGDIVCPDLQSVGDRLWLLPGDVALSGFEDLLSTEWPNSMGDSNLYRPMRVLTAFWQVMQMAAEDKEADIVLVDVGPNLGAINRSVLLATDYVVIPLGADLFSLQGLSNLGPSLRSWRNLWKKRLDNWNGHPEKQQYPQFRLPCGVMRPIGYLCQQYGIRLSRPVVAYDKWVKRVPDAYRQHVLGEAPVEGITPDNDPYCLALIKHFRSLIPMGQEKRKPIFALTPADGAIGAHAGAVQNARQDFKTLAEKIATTINQQGVPRAEVP